MATTIKLPGPARNKMYDKVIEAAYFKCEAKLSENIIIGIIARESIEPFHFCVFFVGLFFSGLRSILKC